MYLHTSHGRKSPSRKARANKAGHGRYNWKIIKSARAIRGILTKRTLEKSYRFWTTCAVFYNGKEPVEIVQNTLVDAIRFLARSSTYVITAYAILTVASYETTVAQFSSSPHLALQSFHE